MSVWLRKWKNEGGAEMEAWWIHVKFRHPGGNVTRVRRASPVDTRRGAEQYERLIRQQLLEGTYGKKEVGPAPTLKEFVEDFLVVAKNENKPSTVEAKQTLLRIHLVPFFGGMRLDEIGKREVDQFKDHMRRKHSQARHVRVAPTKWAIKKRYGGPPLKLNDKTINNCLSVLRKLLGVAIDYEKLKHMPRIKLLKTANSPFDFLSFEEGERFIASAEPEWRAMLLVAVKTGLRRGELIGLQWSDVDLVMGRINARHTMWKGELGTPKGGRERTVDIPPSVVAALKDHRHLKGSFVFCDGKGLPFTPGELKAPLVRALKRSGVSRKEGRIGWHDLRHTYGSHLAIKGVPLKAIQELMGHATIEQTMRYAHLSPETKQVAVLVLDEPVRRPVGDPAGTHTGHMRG